MIKIYEKIKTYNKRIEFEMKNKIHKKQSILEQEKLIISYSLKMVEIQNTFRESIKEAEKKTRFSTS